MNLSELKEKYDAYMKYHTVEEAMKAVESNAYTLQYVPEVIFEKMKVNEISKRIIEFAMKLAIKYRFKDLDEVLENIDELENDMEFREIAEGVKND